MTKYFSSLLEGYNNPANNETVKSIIYDAMEEYAYSYQPGYVCYDMSMYVALYKCAKTEQQRKHALYHMNSIIIDDAFQSHEELIQNFKEFILLKDFLHEEDIIEFDILCMMELDFFKKELEWSRVQAKCGQADFIPDVPVGTAYEYLKEVAELVISTGLPLESFEVAQKILTKWKISCGYFSQLFLKWKNNMKFDKFPYISWFFRGNIYNNITLVRGYKNKKQKKSYEKI